MNPQQPLYQQYPLSSRGGPGSAADPVAAPPTLASAAPAAIGASPTTSAAAPTTSPAAPARTDLPSAAPTASHAAASTTGGTGDAHLQAFCTTAGVIIRDSRMPLICATSLD